MGKKFGIFFRVCSSLVLLSKIVPGAGDIYLRSAMGFCSIRGFFSFVLQGFDADLRNGVFVLGLGGSCYIRWFFLGGWGWKVWTAIETRVQTCGGGGSGV